MNVLMLELLLECLIVLMLEWLAQSNYLNNKAIRQSSNQYNVLVLLNVLIRKFVNSLVFISRLNY